MFHGCLAVDAALTLAMMERGVWRTFFYRFGVPCSNAARIGCEDLEILHARCMLRMEGWKTVATNRALEKHEIAQNAVDCMNLAQEMLLKAGLVFDVS